MSIPTLVDEIHFEEGVNAIATSPKGDCIAVGSKGMLGVYSVSAVSANGTEDTSRDAESSAVNIEEKTLVHYASFMLPEKRQSAGRANEVVDLAFSTCGSILYLKSSEGVRRTLAVHEKENGMLKQISSESVADDEPAYPVNGTC